MLLPSIRTSPRNALEKPITIFRMVDFPAPDGPTKAMVSPGLIWKFRLDRIGASSFEYENATSLNSISPYTSLIFFLRRLSSTSSAVSTSPIELTDSRPFETVGIMLMMLETLLTIVEKYVWYRTTSPTEILPLDARYPVKPRQITWNS